MMVVHDFFARAGIVCHQLVQQVERGGTSQRAQQYQHASQLFALHAASQHTACSSSLCFLSAEHGHVPAWRNAAIYPLFKGQGRLRFRSHQSNLMLSRQL